MGKCAAGRCIGCDCITLRSRCVAAMSFACEAAVAALLPKPPLPLRANDEFGPPIPARDADRGRPVLLLLRGLEAGLPRTDESNCDADSEGRMDDEEEVEPARRDAVPNAIEAVCVERGGSVCTERSPVR